jgi:hypothetical protein
MPSEEPSGQKTVFFLVFCFAIGHPLEPGVRRPCIFTHLAALRSASACHSTAGVIMDTEKKDLEKTEAAEQPRKPIVDQMTDLAAQAAGTLAETAVKAVAKRAKKRPSPNERPHRQRRQRRQLPKLQKLRRRGRRRPQRNELRKERRPFQNRQKKPRRSDQRRNNQRRQAENSGGSCAGGLLFLRRVTGMSRSSRSPSMSTRRSRWVIVLPGCPGP